MKDLTIIVKKTGAWNQPPIIILEVKALCFKMLQRDKVELAVFTKFLRLFKTLHKIHSANVVSTKSTRTNC